MGEDPREVLKRSQDLLRALKENQESKKLLEILPQGHGSGLNADTVDGLHVAEILAKAKGTGGGPGAGAGSGDMTKAVYDTDGDGVVDNSEKLEGSTKAEVQDHAAKEHGDEAHSLAYALSTELADHEGATTGVHGVGAGTVAKVGDIAVDANLSAAAQDAVSKKHAQNTDTDLEATFEATFEKVARKDAASGYAGLSAASKLAVGQMPTGKVDKTLTFSISGTLMTGQKKQRLVAPCDISLLKVRLVADTGPVGADLIIDIHKGTGAGTTIFSTQANRPKILNGAKTGVSVAPDVIAISEGDEFSVYVDQIGSGTAGADLSIELIGTQTVAFS